MKYCHWICKEIIFLIIASYFISFIDGRRYDKCVTPDGREGLCVVKRYCREKGTQSLTPCDNNENFCCPIPTTHRSAQPPDISSETSHNFDNVANNPKQIVPIIDQKQHKPYDNRRTLVSSTDRSVLDSSHQGNGYNIQPGRSYDKPVQNPPATSSEQDERTSYSDRPKTNKNSDEHLVNSESNGRVKFESSIPLNNGDFINKPRDAPHNIEPSKNGLRTPIQTVRKETSLDPVPEVARESNPKIIFPIRSSDEPRRAQDHSGTRHEVFMNSSPNLSNEESSRRTPLEPSDGLRNIRNPSSTRRETSIGSTTSDERLRRIPPFEPKDSRELSYSTKVIKDETDERPKRISPPENKNVLRGYPNSPASGPNKIASSRPDILDSSLEIHSKEKILPLATDDELKRPYNPDLRGGIRSDSGVFENSNPHNRDRTYTSTIPTISRYPSRDQFETQKLPSNPRRIKPLRYDNNNDTDDYSRESIFLAHENTFSKPKVPACGVKPYDLFIAGGETSEAHEWPWMTSIFRRHQGSRPKTFQCGGSLINTKYVLTAAHCFVNNYVILPASEFVIRLGSHYLSSGEEYSVADLVIHHNHSGADFFNDIALIKIASEVYITDKIAPICLPTPDMINENLVDRLATVAGWGDTVFRTGASRALQHVVVPIVSSEECFAAYSRVRGAAFLARGSDHVICAGLREGGKDACLGDSGGPLMLKTIDDRWTIVGIVSLGYKCAEPGYPGVYTRVTHYLSWIQSNMKTH